MPVFTYPATLVPDCAWSRMAPRGRRALVWILWAVVWVALVAGIFEKRYWEWAVWFSGAHAVLALSMVRFRPLVFPAQLRIAYFAWVAIGTYVPYMAWMMYVTAVGVATNMFFGWCPLARTLYLLPWNREEPFDAGLPVRVFFSKPTPGRFRAPAPRSRS